MPRKTEGSYLFRGSAYALAARFTKPAGVIPTQAGVVLGACGGEASVSARNFNRQNIAFSAAEARVTGAETADGAHHALATATIRKLSFMNMVKADLIVAQLKSDHPASGHKEPYKIEEGQVTFGESRFENLQIGGKPVDVKLTTILNTHPTYEEYREIQQRRGKFYTWRPRGAPGPIVTSLVDHLVVPGFKVEGHVVFVPDFGKIHVAEVILEHGYRRLHMLRFELGSPTDGDAVVGGGEGNGTETWP